MEGEAKGLMAIWADIDTDYHLEFEKWHNCEHMADRVTIPGFLLGFRYQGVGVTPYSLMAYETADPLVLESEPYLRSKNNPTDWTREALSHYRNTERLIYKLVASAGKRPATQAPYLYSLRFDLEGEEDAQAIAGLREGVLARIAAAPGGSSARLYRIDAKASNIVTAEQKIYGDGPALKRRFLILAEMGSALWPKDEIWRDLCGQEKAASVQERPTIKNVGEGCYWLRFFMQAPG
jgi:hypothetical protein